MNSDGSLHGGLFDLQSQAGIMNLLASVRASDLSADKKHDLRDTIFLFTNGGRDQSVLLSLEQKITAYKLQPTATATRSAATPAVPTHTIGGSRPTPTTFAARQPVVLPPPAPVAKVAPLPAPARVTPPAAPIPEVVSAPVPPPPPPPPPAPAEPEVAPTTSAADSAVYLERIREIKSLVNQRIGNPVHLVDINPEVGREYMGALLDAMKKINSGTSAISAMKRLEEAFGAVDKVLATEPTTSSSLDATAATPPVSATPPAPVTVPVPPAPVPAPTPISVPEPEPRIVTPPPAPVMPVAPPPPVTANAVPIQRPVAVRAADARPLTNTDAVRPLRPTTGALPVTPVAESVVTPEPVTAPVAQSPHDSRFSAAKLSVLATPPAAPIRKEVSTTSTDPLYSTDIDRGLEQLLSEWSLFKKSGMFGAGPKGREHPLFKKIAGLQIPLLLAGRFEGATQEIKQSITDYMNGWRYEQGIIYMQGETFERYLRRVIKHILDLQNKANRS